MRLFDTDGVWLRCQFHCHTTRSDGTPEPGALATHYAEAGFDVLAVTDHWGLTIPAEERLLVLPASELSARLHRPPFEAEVLALGIDALPDPREEFPTLAACAEWITTQGGVAFLAHPRWSLLDSDDYRSAPLLTGLEVFNGGCEIQQGSGLADEMWDTLLDAGLRPTAIATDDAHDAGSPGGSDSLLGWTMVRARERSREAVLDALRAGSFYASAGPEIHEVVSGTDGSVEVACSPAAAVVFRSGPWDGGRVNADAALADYRGAILERDEAGLILRARMDPPEFRDWGRIEVHDAAGRRAWTNAMDLPGARAPYR
jgi:predicted metal-dependent phosphoesterase TrpH